MGMPEHKHRPEGDLYDLSEKASQLTVAQGIKKVMQAIINSPEIPRRLPKGSRRALPIKDQPQGYPEGCREEAPRNLPTDDLRDWYAAVP